MERAKVIPAGLREKMNDIAHRLDRTFNGDAKGADRKVGFALLVFELGKQGKQSVSYIGNVKRVEMLGALRELVERWDNEAKVGTLDETQR